MAIMYPVYKIFNQKIFGEDIIYLQHQEIKKCMNKRYRKQYEFRTRLPKNLNTGDKVYIYEPKKHGGSGKIVGEFTVGNIVKCDAPYGAFHFIVHFCRHVLKNEDYAKKFEEAVQTELPNYKKGYILKYALDEDSMSHIKKTGTLPDIVDYLYDKKRCDNLDESERVWKWTDEYLRRCGFYDEFGHSDYNYAIEILNPVGYAYPKDLTEFKKLDGSVVENAPQSYVYVQNN